MGRYLVDDALNRFRDELEQNARVTPPHKIAERGARMRRTQKLRRGVMACAMVTAILAVRYQLRSCSVAKD